MLTKLEKLTERIQAIQGFIATTAQDMAFAAISQELEKISNSLKLSKLIVQIVSNDLVSAQALQKFLFSCENLSEFYQFHVATLPGEPDQAIAISSEFYQLVDCDVLYLVVESRQMLSSNERWFIEQVRVSNAPIAKRFVVVEKLEIDSQSDQIGKSLEALVGRKPEEILIKRITTQVLLQVDQIESAYNLEAESLKQEIRQTEEKLNNIKQGNSTDQLKGQVEQALRQVNEDKEKFFRQVKLELNQSKAEFLDGYSRKSIIYKIQAFTDNLQPVVLRKENKKYVQLQAENAQGSADINIDMMHLCYSHLSWWVINEWEQIYLLYGEGGISQFFQKTYTLLSSVPSLRFRASLFQPERDNTHFQKSLKDLVARVPPDRYYKEVSVGSYLIRQIRNQWMGVMFLLTFVSIVGSSPNRKDLVKSILSPIYNLKGSPFLLTVALAIPLCFVFLLLFYNYYQDSQHKLEDEAKKLKRELGSYYQSFAKISVEKLAQDLIVALEAEEDRLRRILDSFRERFTAYITEVTKGQLFLKNDLENLVLQQRILDKARADLQKLKRI